jgi:hypothetical protein
VRTILTVLVVLVLLVGGVYVVRARGANARAEADAVPLFVPVVVTPSVQPVSGQVVLYKATNMSENPVNFRLMIYKDNESVPGFYKDFMKVPAAHTISYVYEPANAELTLGSATVQAPEAVRAVFAPVPAGDPGAIRRIVANVQIMRVQPAGAGGTPQLDTPIVVPVQHCMFEPRGFVPYTGGRWYWNCALEMNPIPEQWRQAGQQRR